MPRSSVSGISGAVRIDRLDMAGIVKAEQHGKRLDWSSMQRRVRSIEPLVWPPGDGLDLMARYERHIEGAFVPKAETKMLHVLVQFPKDLISEDEPERMLEGAMKFIHRVFGPESVVAARIDQDEKGRHVVDVFVVPIYTKKTVHQTKRAVSISKAIKDLATSQGLVDAYNERIEEKRTKQAAERVELRTSLIRTGTQTKFPPRRKEGPYDRSEITRLFTRHRRHKSGGMADADANLRRLPGGELVQATEPANGQPNLGMLVRGEVGEGVQRSVLDPGLRHQEVAARSKKSKGRTGHASGVEPPSLKVPKLITTPSLFMQGAALQTELHAFLRDEMGLAGVRRGVQKKQIGPDWETPERFAIERRQEEVAAQEAAAAEALENSRELERLARLQTATAGERNAVAAALLAQAEARQREVTATEAAAAEALENSRRLERIAGLQTATADKRNAAAAELLAQAEAREAEVSTAERNVMAMGVGIDAWSAGDVTPVRKDDGTKVMRYRDEATKERLAPLLRPVFQQLWEWMMQAAKAAQAVADRAAELVQRAIADREQAATERAAASAELRAAKLEADRLRREAVVNRELAASVMERAKAAEAEVAETKRQTGDLAVKAHEFMAAAMDDRDLAAEDRARAAALTTPDALQRRLQAFATPERVAAAIDAKVTPEAIQKRLDALVTPGLVLDVLNGKVEAARAANSAVAAAHFLRGRGQER